MDDQFRAVPDGQYTQTIYTLIKEQKYNEVSFICKLTLFACRSSPS